MSNLYFPSLPGLAWDIKIMPLFSTLVHESVSGREVRAALQQYPRYEIGLSYTVLKNDPAQRDETGQTELETLQNFFLQMQGSFDDFLVNLTDLTKRDADSIVVGALIGIGDGVTTSFQIVRQLGGFTDIVQNPAINNTVQSALVYVDNVAKTQGTDYSITNGIVTFLGAAPSVGVTVTADFTALLRCRFNTTEANAKRSQSSIDPVFNNFMYLLWECQQIDLITVKV